MLVSFEDRLSWGPTGSELEKISLTHTNYRSAASPYSVGSSATIATTSSKPGRLMSVGMSGDGKRRIRSKAALWHIVKSTSPRGRDTPRTAAYMLAVRTSNLAGYGSRESWTTTISNVRSFLAYLRR